MSAEEKTYAVAFKPRAVKDISKLERSEQERIIDKIEKMKKGLRGDVRKLTAWTPEYRLRVGDFRILFEIENENIIIYRVLNRRAAYKTRR